jgi:hypothetical protein
MLSSTYH